MVRSLAWFQPTGNCLQPDLQRGQSSVATARENGSASGERTAPLGLELDSGVIVNVLI